MIKLTSTAIFTEEEMADFATHELGYKPVLTRTNDSDGESNIEEYSNPQPIDEFVKEAFEKHELSFLSEYKNRKVREATAQLEAQFEAGKQQATEAIEQQQDEALEVTIEEV